MAQAAIAWLLLGIVSAAADTLDDVTKAAVIKVGSRRFYRIVFN